MAFIIKPLVTEKMTKITDKTSEARTYKVKGQERTKKAEARFGFIVRPEANKLEIKKEVEEMYNVTVIDHSTFEGCSNLSDVCIGLNTTLIDDSAFRNCKSLISIVIPNSVKEIRSGAFYGCLNIEDLTLGTNVEIIENEVFYNCDNLCTKRDCPYRNITECFWQIIRTINNIRNCI